MQRRRPKAAVVQNEPDISSAPSRETKKRRKRGKSGNGLGVVVCIVMTIAFLLTTAAVKMTTFEHRKEAAKIPPLTSTPVEEVKEEVDGTPKAPAGSTIVECKITTENWNNDEAANGTLRITVHKNAPLSELFLYLVTEGYYDNNYIFRVIKGFHAQWGFHTESDMKQWWSRIEQKKSEVDSENEKTDLKNVKGALTMIRGASPQVFLNLGSAPWLDDEGTLPLGFVDAESIELADKIFTGYKPGSGQIPAMINGSIPELFPRMSMVEKCSIKS